MQGEIRLPTTLHGACYYCIPQSPVGWFVQPTLECLQWLLWRIQGGNVLLVRWLPFDHLSIRLLPILTHLFLPVTDLPDSGGNWKCNGTNKLVDEIVSSLNDVGEYPTHTEVVIAVPGIYFDSLWVNYLSVFLPPRFTGILTISPLSNRSSSIAKL